MVQSTVNDLLKPPLDQIKSEPQLKSQIYNQKTK